MIPKECNRRAEVDFPIAVVSKHAAREKCIRHKSYVHYARARIEASQSIVNGVKKGLFVPKAMLVEAIFARVCKGLVESRFTSPRILSFYEAVEAERHAKN